MDEALVQCIHTPDGNGSLGMHRGSAGPFSVWNALQFPFLSFSPCRGWNAPSIPTWIWPCSCPLCLALLLLDLPPPQRGEIRPHPRIHDRVKPGWSQAALEDLQERPRSHQSDSLGNALCAAIVRSCVDVQGSKGCRTKPPPVHSTWT